MTFNSPWARPKKRKKKAKKKKRVVKKKRAKKKRAKKAKPKKKIPKKKAGRKKAKKVRRARGRARSERVVVSKKELDKLRKNVARPKWVDQLPESKRKVFSYKGKSYWPLYSLLYVVDAVEVVPLSQWAGPTNRQERGSLLRSGFVKKIRSKNYVYVMHTQFIQRGSPLDV